MITKKQEEKIKKAIEKEFLNSEQAFKELDERVKQHLNITDDFLNIRFTI